MTLRRSLIISAVLFCAHGPLLADDGPRVEGNKLCDERSPAQGAVYPQDNYSPISCGNEFFQPVSRDRARIAVTEENDKFASNNDRNYTQGIAFSYLTPDVSGDGDWSRPFDAISSVLPILDGDGKRKYSFFIGQSIFTPTDVNTYELVPDERPYAGWLYVGTSMLQESNENNLENLEFQLGIIGPWALGRQAQNGFHRLFGMDISRGWDNQLSNEPGIVVSYERKWRFGQELGSGFAIDVIPEAGASVGNVFTYAQTGAIFRFGQDIDVDYGPNHIRPNISGTSWFDGDRLDGDFGWYLFAGGGGRAVARNITLDGNTWKDSHSIGKETFVGDLVFGASAYWSSDIKLDLAVTHRTKEYEGQADTDTFGMINLSIGL